MVKQKINGGESFDNSLRRVLSPFQSPAIISRSVSICMKSGRSSELPSSRLRASLTGQGRQKWLCSAKR